MTKVQRYKVGFFSDEWGMSSITPCLIPDDSGFAVKFEDYCKLEAENERLKAELAKYRDAPVVAYIRKWAFDGEEPKKEKRENGRLAWPFKFKLIPVSQSMLLKDDIPLIVKPGEEK